MDFKKCQYIGSRGKPSLVLITFPYTQNPASSGRLQIKPYILSSRACDLKSTTSHDFVHRVRPIPYFPAKGIMTALASMIRKHFHTTHNFYSRFIKFHSLGVDTPPSASQL